MNIKKHIPNLLTLGNLFCGTVAVIYAVEGNFEMAAFLVLLGILFDFFDGFVARLLNVSGELGKQLDSLADMVTSGVVPGIVMFKLIQSNILDTPQSHFEDSIFGISLFGFLLTLGACYRLANFNIDTRQSNSFIGLPTPAMCLFVVSLPIMNSYEGIHLEFMNSLVHNNYVLIVITLLLTYLMNAEIVLFSLKFKDYSIQNNIIKYIFLLVSLLMIIFLQVLSVPLIITFYVLLSIITNFGKKTKI